MCVNFQLKQTTLTFLAQICPKRKLGFEIHKTNIKIRISIFVTIFRQNGQLWIFGPKFAQKWILGLEIWSKFGKIAQLRAIFWFKYCWGCCRELDGGWNELGGGGWRWVEVGTRFSNKCFEKYSSQAKFKTTYIFKPNIFKRDEYILIRKVFCMTTRNVYIIK